MPEAKNRNLKLIHYLLSRKVIDEKTGCWFLKNPTKSKYPKATFDGIKETLARLSAKAFLEFDIDNDLKLEICHKCDVKACFNPDHLYIGTHGSNKRDYWTRQARISENHCVHGHEYTLDSNNKKICKECQKINRNKNLIKVNWNKV